ncbi:MAG: glycosyltransferase, partial [Bacteroidota bacterium]|nr:glycosyltransferase [Bacteroidota bacterium]MDX5429454.1 glycosyltransferase [Bacteroidota bacterium]MDX5468246.1 glycosyltransferase [Bacteroidota bacterium]
CWPCMKIKSEHIHLIAFDIPYPANYGGVIDIFFKLKALHLIGVKVTLHCYQYGREQSEELEKYASKVFYYKRRTFKNPFYSKLPYIVASRNTTELLENLLSDDRPILFEGLHCCYYLNHPALKNRLKIVRTHNVEHDYYSKLEEVENNFFKKYFFRIESERLKRFESQLKHANLIAAISPADYAHFAKKFPQSFYLPAFHPNEHLSSKEGKGDYAFYHGNLSVGENDQAARFLVNEVFNDLDIPLIIAGSNPSRELVKSLEDKPHIQLLNHLNSEEMLRYIQEAQINVLPTFQSTGIKLKLINSLYLGRHCLVNAMMVNETGLESFCIIANTASQFKKELKKYMNEGFTEEDIASRALYLETRFSNIENARKLMAAIHEAKTLLESVPTHNDKSFQKTY